MTFKPTGNGASAKSLANYKVLRLGDVAFEGHSNKQFSYGRFVVNDNADGIMSPRFATIRPIKAININYWKNYLHNENIMKYVLVKSTKAGTMMNELVYSDLYKQVLKVPNITEQVKIGNLLQKIEIIITLQQRKLEQLKRLKKAMLQQLFANNNSKQPNLRFKNFKGDWEQCKLGELIESLFQGINTAADKVEYSNNGLPIIQAKNITSGSLDFSGSRKLSVQKYSNYLDKYIPQKGDILFANIGTIGPNVILKDTRQFFIAWNILRIVPQKNINGEFLKITLDLLNSKHYFEKLLTGNATKFVNKNDMRNLPIFFSDPEEQNKISNLFKKLDFLITLQQNKLTQLTILKKYLLQKMFI